MGPKLYVWSDAWLLASIASSERDGRAELEDVLSVGDALDHAVFTASEIENGCLRLMSGGYIEPLGPPFRLTVRAKQVFVELGTRFPFNADQRQQLEQLIGASSYGETPAALVDASQMTWRLDISTFEDALRKFQQRSIDLHKPWFERAMGILGRKLGRSARDPKQADR